MSEDRIDGGREMGGSGAAPALALAEVTGLHGAFVFPERLLQQIWLRGEFDAQALRLRDGRPLRLVRRGRWNRLPGPDFREAELRIGGEDGVAEILRGDVEVHLRAADWDQHGHARDPAYDAVALHVVLFPSARVWTEGGGGRRIPILELLPLLERDLEAYAEEAAVEGLAGRPYSQLRTALAGLSAEVLAAEVERHATRRWANKVALARRRIEAAGWEEACHQAALEVLGYRPNRVPMLAVAERWPLAAWRENAVTFEEVWASQEGSWQRAGVRPANQPRTRLAQYASWVRARPDWPARLVGLGEALATACGGDCMAASKLAGEHGLRARRRALGLTAWRRRWATEIAGDVIGGTRFDTLVCDAWLPLLAARARAAGEADRTGVGLERVWRDWAPGDAPAELLRLAREFGVGDARDGGVLGQGDLQGLLGWLATLPGAAGRGT